MILELWFQLYNINYKLKMIGIYYLGYYYVNNLTYEEGRDQT